MSTSSLGNVYLTSVIKRITTYKLLGEGTFMQLEEKDFYYTPNEWSNSIAVIIQHLSGNMISRWTNFLTEDGEKPGRNRETEFSLQGQQYSREQLIGQWEKGWSCLLDTLSSLTAEDLLRTIHIRHEPLLAIDAINRQLAHYPHHVGQIVYIGKMIRGKDWQSLSIPKGGSDQFNRQMQEQHGR
jgi:hypothetical protein